MVSKFVGGREKQGETAILGKESTLPQCFFCLDGRLPRQGKQQQNLSFLGLFCGSNPVPYLVLKIEFKFAYALQKVNGSIFPCEGKHIAPVLVEVNRLLRRARSQQQFVLMGPPV